jgi:hypothetical protein
MTEAEQLMIGSEIACSDGVCGELTRVVVDPLTRALTHLVVEPADRQAAGRLVPIALVAEAQAGVRLHCTMAEFQALEQADEAEFVPGAPGELGYADGQLLWQPHFVLGVGMDASAAGTARVGAGPHVIYHDRVPVGEVELRRGQRVHATDAEIGRVRGLLIDRADHHVTHVLLDEGHLWGHKTVAIPIGAVIDVTAGVRLALTKDQVRDLPAVEVSHLA